MTTTPSKPSRSRSRPVTIARRLRGDPARVERRVERVREHHERHAGGDRGAERDQVALHAAAHERRAVVGVHVRAAEAGEVLRGGGHAAPTTCPRPRRACGPRSPPASPAKARERITGAAPPGTSATGARFTFTPAPRSCRAAARAPRAHRPPASPCSGWPAGRPGPADRADLAALLVDHHQRRPARRRAAARAVRPRHCAARAGVEAEQDHARRSRRARRRRRM